MQITPGKDPYFRNRYVLVAAERDASPWGRWALWLLMSLAVAAGGYWLMQRAETPLPSVTDAPPAPLPVVVAETPSLPPAPSAPAVVESGPTPAPSAPLPVPFPSAPLRASDSAQGTGTETGEAQGTAEEAQPTPASPVSPTPPVSPAVAQLLTMAQRQIAEARLTLPAQDNAHLTYQRLLALDPGVAQQVLDGILLHYLEMARQRLAVQDFDEAEVLYHKMHSLDPEHQTLLSLREDFMTSASTHLEALIQAQQLTQATAMYTQMRNFAPQHDRTAAARQSLVDPLLDQAERQSLVTALLNQAERQMRSYHYTTPADDNAYASYQAVLRLLPGQPQAQAGLARIAAVYTKLANQQLQRKNFSEASAWVKRALQVLPEDKALLALAKNTRQAQEKYRRQQQAQAAAEAAQVRAVPAPATVPVPTTNETTRPHRSLSGVEGSGEGAERNRRESPPDPQEAKLLLSASRQLVAGHLLEPPGNNAYETYQQLLRLRPEHPMALRGIQQIANRYEILARRAYAQGENQRSLALIGEGLTIAPSHAGLAQLRQTILESY